MADGSTSDDSDASSTGPVVCYNCASPLEEGQNHCGACGKIQDESDDGEDEKCVACGNHLLEDALHCRNCGWDTPIYLEMKEKGTLPKRKKFKPPVSTSRYAIECDGCAEIFTDNGSFCMNCGMLRGDVQQCDECGNVFMDDSKFCRACGAGRKIILSNYTPLCEMATYEPKYPNLFKRMNAEKVELEKHTRYQYAEHKKSKYGGFTGVVQGGPVVSKTVKIQL